jgi:predicted RNA binding protein YcfA (HicA-like mRNA interferase family)
MTKQVNYGRTAREICQTAKKQGFYVEEGGRHTHILDEYGNTITVVPRHKGDLANGTVKAIVTALIAATALLFIGGFYIHEFIYSEYPVLYRNIQLLIIGY